jgi:nucleoside-diphosphate-sugar epimerase
VTAGSGQIGSAVITELIKAGHTALALARSDNSASIVRGLGAQVLRGELEDLDVLKKGAQECDGVAHLGFGHDFSRLAAMCATDLQAILAMCSVLAGTKKPLIATFGSLMLPNDHFATEEDFQPRQGFFSDRFRNEDAIIEQGKQGINAMAMRLPPTVHGKGDHGFVPHMIASAKKNGRSVYVDQGTVRWPTVHRYDAAKLYVLVLENPQPGKIIHAIHEQGVCMKDIASTIGKELGLPTVSIPAGPEASQHFGFLAPMVQLDNPVSSQATRDFFGWKTSEVGLLEDLEQGHYFDAGAASKFS